MLWSSVNTNPSLQGNSIITPRSVGTNFVTNKLLSHANIGTNTMVRKAMTSPPEMQDKIHSTPLQPVSSLPPQSNTPLPPGCESVTSDGQRQTRMGKIHPTTMGLIAHAGRPTLRNQMTPRITDNPQPSSSSTAVPVAHGMNTALYSTQIPITPRLPNTYLVQGPNANQFVPATNFNGNIPVPAQQQRSPPMDGFIGTAGSPRPDINMFGSCSPKGSPHVLSGRSFEGPIPVPLQSTTRSSGNLQTRSVGAMMARMTFISAVPEEDESELQEFRYDDDQNPVPIVDCLSPHSQRDRTISERPDISHLTADHSSNSDTGHLHNDTNSREDECKEKGFGKGRGKGSPRTGSMRISTKKKTSTASSHGYSFDHANEQPRGANESPSNAKKMSPPKTAQRHTHGWSFDDITMVSEDSPSSTVEVIHTMRTVRSKQSERDKTKSNELFDHSVIPEETIPGITSPMEPIRRLKSENSSVTSSQRATKKLNTWINNDDIPDLDDEIKPSTSQSSNSSWVRRTKSVGKEGPSFDKNEEERSSIKTGSIGGVDDESQLTTTACSAQAASSSGGRARALSKSSVTSSVEEISPPVHSGKGWNNNGRKSLPATMHTARAKAIRPKSTDASTSNSNARKPMSSPDKRKLRKGNGTPVQKTIIQPVLSHQRPGDEVCAQSNSQRDEDDGVYDNCHFSGSTGDTSRDVIKVMDVSNDLSLLKSHRSQKDDSPKSHTVKGSSKPNTRISKSDQTIKLEQTIQNLRKEGGKKTMEMVSMQKQIINLEQEVERGTVIRQQLESQLKHEHFQRVSAQLMVKELQRKTERQSKEQSGPISGDLLQRLQQLHNEIGRTCNTFNQAEIDDDDEQHGIDLGGESILIKPDVVDTMDGNLEASYANMFQRIEERMNADSSSEIISSPQQEPINLVPSLPATLLESITIQEISTYRSLDTPPLPLRGLMEVICMLFDILPEENIHPLTQEKSQDYWEPARQLMRDPFFLTKLKDLETGDISEKVWMQIEKRLLLPDIKRERVEKCGPAALKIFDWIDRIRPLR